MTCTIQEVAVLELCSLYGRLRWRVSLRKRRRSTIAASIAFSFRAHFPWFLETRTPLMRGWISLCGLWCKTVDNSYLRVDARYSWVLRCPCLGHWRPCLLEWCHIIPRLLPPPAANDLLPLLRGGALWQPCRQLPCRQVEVMLFAFPRLRWAQSPIANR